MHNKRRGYRGPFLIFNNTFFYSDRLNLI